ALAGRVRRGPRRRLSAPGGATTEGAAVRRVADYADAARAELQGPAVRPLKNFRRVLLTPGLVSATGGAALVPGSPLAGGSVARVAVGRAIDDKFFEPGSCVEFAPTSGDRHLTVFLDAGHGGIDPGGVGETESGQTIYEEDETLPVELDTAKLLEAKGFTVVVSRMANVTVSRPQPDDISGGL